LDASPIALDQPTMGLHRAAWLASTARSRVLHRASKTLRPSIAALERRLLPSLSTSFVLNGHVSAEVAAYAAGIGTNGSGVQSTSGLLTLRTIPSGARIERATLYAEDSAWDGPPPTTHARAFFSDIDLGDSLAFQQDATFDSNVLL